MATSNGKYKDNTADIERAAKRICPIRLEDAIRNRSREYPDMPYDELWDNTT